PLAILLTGHYRRQAVISRQQAVVSRQQAEFEAIRRRGGMVVLGLSDEIGSPSDVKNIDLSNANIDAELMRTISKYATVERIALDGAKLQPEDYALLGKLPRLRKLSLSRSNVTDTIVSGLPLGLTFLWLSGTSVTDKSMSRLAEMKYLVNLDITGTEITPDGLRLLEPLRSLQTLWIDDSCITVESVESLRLMRPRRVDVAVSEGLGRRSHELLSVCDGPKISGLHRDGYALWVADLAWSETLAGIVEAVVSEIGLDSQQATQLLDTLVKEPSPEGWSPTVRDPLRATAAFSYGPRLPDKGMEIASVDEFIRELRKDFGDFDEWAVCRFAKEQFTASDVPQLLAAIHTVQSSRDDRLFWHGPFLLVQHGIDNPDVRAELDRLLAHKEFFVRINTIYAFGVGGAAPFYSREEWVASKAADAFAVPRLVRICRADEADQLHDAARHVLAEIAQRRPEYAAEVLPVLVDLLETGPWER
ncbi:MAG: hypothetical protein HYV60_07165, partial [Planctomycetia bacterium]|nr:hypothetical protein [Planctomycetia bacterium]